jgi:hypothetical protein
MACVPLALLSGRPVAMSRHAPGWSVRVAEVGVETSGSRVADAILRSVIWGFVGALFGVLFVVAHDVLAPAVPGVSPLLVAAAMAGSIGAAIYSSMRLAVLVAGFCALLLAVLQLGGFLRGTAGSGAWNLHGLVGLATAIGGLAGAYYGRAYPRSGVCRALPKTLAGLFAGLGVAGGWWLVLQWVGEVPLPVSIAVLCPLVGWSYVALSRVMVRACTDRLPPVAAAALVGAVISGLVALGFWATAGTLQPQIVGATAGEIQSVVSRVPVALLAGWLGGMVAGFTRGLLGFGWYDL